MRIIAGQFRGRRLASVGAGDTGTHLRPTADRVRESLFNILGNQGVIEGAVVLDLFAGTGALGLEALSRGARLVTFVDQGRIAQGLIRENIRLTDSAAATRLLARDATRLGACEGLPATLVFLDPPYGKGVGAKALASAMAGGWIAPEALVVWEDDRPANPPSGLVVSDIRRYGGTHVTVMQVAGPGDP